MALGFGDALVAANFNSGWYQTVLVVHLVCAVVGFGGSALGTVMLRRAWADGPDAAAAVRRAFEFASNRLTDMAAYLAGIAGVVAVPVDARWTFRPVDGEQCGDRGRNCRDGDQARLVNPCAHAGLGPDA